MIEVAGLIREHRDVLAATFRQTFGVSVFEVGGRVSWGEALSLITIAARDTRTYFGAELAEFAYPASVPELVTVAANSNPDKPSVLPDALRERRESRHVSDAERNELEAQYLAVSAFRNMTT